MIDIVILSNAHTPELRALTQQTIDSCKISDDIPMNFIVVEQTDTTYNVPSYHYDQPFNYNRFMNFGISKGKNRYIAMCNNDLLFGAHWATNIIQAMKEFGLQCACPICPNVQGNRYHGKIVDYGYAIREQVSGWCIVIDRELLKKIGELRWHEELPFWYSDNIFMRQLQQNGVLNAIVTTSVVQHIQSKTISLKERNQQIAWMQGSWKRFKELCDAGQL